MPVPNTKEVTTRTSLSDIAADAIRAAIFDGTLAPGEVLHDSELQEWLGVSRTPIREALGALSGTADGSVDSSCLGFSGRVSGRCVDYLELDGRKPSESSLPTPAVVGPLDPGHDLEAELLSRLPSLLVENVLLQEREERLHGGVVRACSDPAHRSGDSVLAEQFDELP